MKNKRSLSETDIIIDNKKPRYDFDRKELISPSHLRNYILNDPLIDYLEYYKINTINETPNRERTNSIVSNDFEEFIKLKGIDFEPPLAGITANIFLFPNIIYFILKVTCINNCLLSSGIVNYRVRQFIYIV